jgi:hypothetical protein
MQYCDGLDADDLRQSGIGPIAAGGFYVRPTSLESKVRGTDEKLWREAVKSLNKAVTLKPELALPRASLGVAYLVDPDGKQAKKASQYFKEALERLDKDSEAKLNPLATAAVWLNSGVADAARGDLAAAKERFQKVDKMLGKGFFSMALEDALLYNQALLEAKSPDKDKKRAACSMFETYLIDACPDSTWWPLGYNHYVKLAKETDYKAKPRADLAKRRGPSQMRLLVSVPVGAESITLAEPAREAVARLGKDVVEQPLFPGSKIARWRSSERGIDVLAKDKVLAIFLTSAKAPPVTIRAGGVASKGRELRVGMTEKDAEEILKGQHAEKGKQVVADAKIDFRFFPELGLGVRFEDKRVEELVIAQVPRRSFLELD